MTRNGHAEAGSTAATTRHIDLKIDRDLLNPKFDGYQLKADRTVLRRLDLEHDVPAAVPNPDTQWSFAHSSLFSRHNALHTDGRHTGRVFFVDSQSRIQQLWHDSLLDSGKLHTTAVGQLPAAELGSSSRDDALPVSLCFVTAGVALAVDGGANLHLFDRHTAAPGSGSDVERWEHRHGVDLSAVVNTRPLRACQVLDAVLDADPAVLHVLLLSIGEKKQKGSNNTTTSSSNSTERPDTSFAFELHWLKMDAASLAVQRHWTWQAPGQLHAAALLSTDGRSHIRLMALVDKPVALVYDSRQPVADAVSETSTATKATAGSKDVPSSSNVSYVWSQTSDEVNCTFVWPAGLEKDAVSWVLSRDAVTVRINDEIIIEGQLGGSVDVEGSVWTLDDDKRLQLSLAKSDGAEWTEMVVGDTRGITEDEGKVAQTVQALAGLQDDKPVYNSQQLEECDEAEQMLTLQLLDPFGHALTDQCDLGGHQYLFADVSSPSGASLCVRHDVDAVLVDVQLVVEGGAGDDGQPRLQLTHSHTVDAFGYVQASKTNRKYVGCAPDRRFSCVIECSGHAFVYLPPAALQNCELKNRKTGETIGRVAHQRVFGTITNAVLGWAVADDTLYLLCASELLYVRITD